MEVNFGTKECPVWTFVHHLTKNSKMETRKRL